MMRIGWGMMICLWAASVSVLAAQEAKSVKTTHRSHSHHAHSTNHAKHAGSTPAKPTEAYVNQGPVAPKPTAEAELSASATASAVEAAPVVPPVVVTYEQGALAITTHDAPLREILDKVREATGAVIEAPDLEQHVSVTVGADAPVRAIASLLDGMHLDYAMLGGTSVNDPVRKIIIEARGVAPGPMAGLDAPGAQKPGPGVIPSGQPAGDDRAWENAPARPARQHR